MPSGGTSTEPLSMQTLRPIGLVISNALTTAVSVLWPSLVSKSSMKVNGNAEPTRRERLSMLLSSASSHLQLLIFISYVFVAINFDIRLLASYEIEVNPPLYVLNEGENMEIHCSAQGAQEIPNTDLEWFFRPVGSNVMQPLDFGPGGFVRTDDPRAKYTSVITKFHVTTLDEGEYICREPRGQTGISTLQIRE